MYDTLDLNVDGRMMQDREEKNQMKEISKEKHGGLSNETDTVADKDGENKR